MKKVNLICSICFYKKEINKKECNIIYKCPNCGKELKRDYSDLSIIIPEDFNTRSKK